MTYQNYLTLEILPYLWIPLSVLVWAKFHWLLLLSLLWTFALFSLTSKHWTQFLDPFSSLHTTSAWKLIWFCAFKYNTGLGKNQFFYVHFSPLSWIFRCLYPHCLLESLLGSQSCILNLHAQGWTRNFTLQFSVFISGFPSNPHAAFPISGQIYWHQICSSFSHIPYPKTIKKSWRLYLQNNTQDPSTFHHLLSCPFFFFFWSKHWHLLSIFNRFLTCLSASSLPVFYKQRSHSYLYKLHS